MGILARLNVNPAKMFLLLLWAISNESAVFYLFLKLQEVLWLCSSYSTPRFLIYTHFKYFKLISEILTYFWNSECILEILIHSNDSLGHFRTFWCILRILIWFLKSWCILQLFLKVILTFWKWILTHLNQILKNLFWSKINLKKIG